MVYRFRNPALATSTAVSCPNPQGKSFFWWDCLDLCPFIGAFPVSYLGVWRPPSSISQKLDIPNDKQIALEVIHGDYSNYWHFLPSSSSGILQQEVNSLHLRGAIEKVPSQYHGKGFYSCYFGFPRIMEASSQSMSVKFIQNLKFHMISLASIIISLEEDKWFTALDVKDAYFHIDIHPVHRSFLGFLFDHDH